MTEAEPTRILGSSPHQPTQPMQPPQPPSSKKWLYGCGCGCLVLVGVPVILFAIFYAWATGTRTPVNPELAWASGQPSMVAIRLDPKDPGVAEFIQRLAARIDAERPETIPGDARALMGKLGKKSTREILEALIPLNVGIGFVGESVRDEDSPDVVLLSFSQFGNLIGTVANKLIEQTRDFGRVTSVHKGKSIEPVRGDEDRPRWAAVRENTIAVATTANDVKGILDRIEGGSTELGDVGVYRARIPGTPEACGILDNRSGWFLKAREWTARMDQSEGFIRDIQGIAWSADLVTASTLRLALQIRMTEARRAESYAAFLERHREAIFADWRSRWSFDFGGTVSAEGEWVRVELDVTGFESDLQNVFLGGKD